MKKSIFLPVVLVVSMISVCLAAAVDGKWKGFIADQYEFNIDVKAEGEVLTGVAYTTGSPEKMKITDGVIKGNDISFKINSPTYGEIPYVGKVNGDKMTLTLNVGGNVLDTELTRVK